MWAGGFIATADVRRRAASAGPGGVLGAQPGVAARRAGRRPGEGGGAPRHRQRHDRARPPHEVAFPNLDLTAHLHTQPQGEWAGFDTSVTFGAAGVGLTHTTLHDEHGPIGAMAQALTLRPA